MPPKSLDRRRDQSEVVASEIEEVGKLIDRLKLVQQRWSELFEQIQDIDMRYPNSAKFENDHFRSDRAYLNPEDKAEYDVLQAGMDSVDAERAALDKEILTKRFEAGLKHLEELNQAENVAWEMVAQEKDPRQYLQWKIWRARSGRDVVEVEMHAQRPLFFEDGMAQFAEQIGDTKVIEDMKHWPKKRALEFLEINLDFSISPKKLFGTDDRLKPGVSLHERFNPYDADKNVVDAGLPSGKLSHNAYSFPKLDDSAKERAKEQMLKLGRSLGLEL